MDVTEAYWTIAIYSNQLLNHSLLEDASLNILWTNEEYLEKLSKPSFGSDKRHAFFQVQDVVWQRQVGGTDPKSGILANCIPPTKEMPPSPCDAYRSYSWALVDGLNDVIP